MVNEKIGANQQAIKTMNANPRYGLELFLKVKKRFEVVKNIKIKIFENPPLR